tara:strand:- start:321 stop:500 length:180 start_codon:yes stop_codon:yes gene_type:complete
MPHHIGLMKLMPLRVLISPDSAIGLIQLEPWNKSCYGATAAYKSLLLQFNLNLKNKNIK